VGCVTIDQRNGIALASGAAALVGGSVAASSLLSAYPVLGGQAVRYAIAAVSLAVWAQLRHRRLPQISWADGLWLNLLAAFGLAACSVAQIEATRLSDPAVVGVVIGAAPVLIAVLAPAIARRRPSGRVLLAAGIVVAGSAVTQIGTVGTGRPTSLAGALATIAALAGVAATSLLAQPVLPRLGALAMSAYACGFAAAQLFLLAVGLHLTRGTPILTAPTAAQAAALAYLTVIVTAVVFLAWYSAVQRLGVERAGLFNGVIPVATLAAVGAVGTGTISGLQVAGAASVAGGILVGLTGIPFPNRPPPTKG
jgi:drug/metabolite transporter (DMT)-like permease